VAKVQLRVESIIGVLERTPPSLRGLLKDLPKELERGDEGEDTWSLGVVTLGQLLGAWMVHDLGHIAQIARVMAKQFGDEVGPWRAYLPVLDSRSAS